MKNVDKLVENLPFLNLDHRMSKNLNYFTLDFSEYTATREFGVQPLFLWPLSLPVERMVVFHVHAQLISDSHSSLQRSLLNADTASFEICVT